MKAIFNGAVLAESNETVLLGTERYFPPATVCAGYLVKNGRTRFCHWKGYGECFDVRVEDVVLPDAAWTYPHPFWEAEEVKGMVAFGEGVEVVV
jgi:uncharacterized protein (DUF427 family)